MSEHDMSPQYEDGQCDGGTDGEVGYGGDDERVSVALGVLSVLKDSHPRERTAVDNSLREEAGQLLLRRLRDWNKNESNDAMGILDDAIENAIQLCEWAARLIKTDQIHIIDPGMTETVRHLSIAKTQVREWVEKKAAEQPK